MIQVNYTQIESAAADIQALKSKLVGVGDNMIESLGEASDKNREVCDFLRTLSSQDLPRLFDSTALLLRMIAGEFRRADAEASSNY